jgi:hypothetical protein
LRLDGEEAALLVAEAGAGGALSSGADAGDAGPEHSAPASSVPLIAARGGVAVETAAPGAAGAPPMPGLEELVAGIPRPVREVLDELFRVRFTAVRRYPAPGTEA